MSTPAMHPAACAFRAQRHKLALGADVSLAAFWVDDLGLIVSVKSMAVWRFNPHYLAHGPAKGNTLLSHPGQRVWDQLTALGKAIAASYGGESAICALLLGKTCLSDAQAAFASERQVA